MPTRTELANAIRFLSMDAVERAKSGHPGAPMGMADIAEVLWRDFLKHNPANPEWYDRDRFVLSNGHGSMLLYSLLHLSGYDLSIEDLKNFRQFHSKTPGHPEYGYTPGVETTTGPLGQGISNAVGMALAEKLLAAEFNTAEHTIVNHHTWVFLGDGCLMEGISHEACSLAGCWELGKLIAFYDDNGISIDGDVNGWFTDDTAKRFEAYGWQVLETDGHNTDAIRATIVAAKAETAKPTLIRCKTIIGKGAPNKQGGHDVHGSPLGSDEIAAARQSLNWPYAPFEIPQEIYNAWDSKTKGQEQESLWNQHFAAYRLADSNKAEAFVRRMQGKLPADWAQYVTDSLNQVNQEGKTIATRKASQNAIECFTKILPELLGGSADLTPSNLTNWSTSVSFSHDQCAANYIHYGVREFGMAGIMNGITLHKGLKPFGATFLMFSEYARNALRMAALMKINPIFVFTHDSIGLGEDGPTHQPVEQIASLRLIPNMAVWRPCDTVETLSCWAQALQADDHPSTLIFSRQNLPFIPRQPEQIANIARGGYILSPASHAKAVLIATGSEVALALEAQKQLAEENIAVHVVSMPCTHYFDLQPQSYQDEVLPPQLPRIAIEAGVSDGWYRYVGSQGAVIGLDHFGESAPAAELFKAFGFTAEHIAEVTKKIIG